MLLGRPNVLISHQWSMYEGQFRAVDLSSDFIFEDLREYIGDHLEKMSFRRLYGEDIQSTGDLLSRTSPNLIEDLARQAEGLFLWTQLLVNLLESPALSPSNRFHMLTSPGYLHGLDGLYDRTLEVLRRKLPKEQQAVQLLFRWIRCSSMPLTMEALHIVLTISPGRQTTRFDYLPNYPKCIPISAGALVEVIPNQHTFSFIYITFKEFCCRHNAAKTKVIGTFSRRQSHIVLEVPIFDHRESNDTARATSWWGTEACEATRDPTTDIEPPMPTRMLDMTSALVFIAVTRPSSMIPMPMILMQRPTT